MTTLPLDKLNIVLICEVDEIWSFVMSKKLQRWLWYAWEPRLKRIIAHAFGDRSTETLNVLLMRMKNFNVAFWCTDKFKSYDILPKEKHIVGKLYTQRIERENLTLRNRLNNGIRLRKQLCYKKLSSGGSY